MTEPRVAATSERRVSELIELGRDREAAALAVGHDSEPTSGGTMDVFSQLDELGPLLGKVFAGISPDQLDNETPCAEFTVRGVLEHMIGGATTFAAGFRGAEPTTPDTSDPLAGIGPALTNVVEAIHSPGALERTLTTPMGDMPGETFARFVVLDGIVHGWDLSTATGQSYEPSDELVSAVDAFARQALPAERAGMPFDNSVEPPASATPIERLVAFTGRQA